MSVNGTVVGPPDTFSLEKCESHDWRQVQLPASSQAPKGVLLRVCPGCGRQEARKLGKGNVFSAVQLTQEELRQVGLDG